MRDSDGRGRVRVLIGTQWGDEGKGRVVDVLAREIEVVVRYQGGANAGHTVVEGGRKHVFHLLPSGMLYPDRLCVIGNGVVIDPDQLRSEIDLLDPRPETIGTRLVVSRAAHIVMPYHKALDAGREKLMKSSKSGAPIGTTGRGIGPCYVDKYERVGIRAEDLVSPDALARKIELNLELKNPIVEQLYGEPPFDFDEIFAAASEWGRYLEPYLGDSTIEIDRAYRAGKDILFEGAQATLLDIDHGTYPFVTSSSCTAGGACIGGAIGPGRIDSVIGVAKAYCTRVGEGPFPTEEHGSVGEELRRAGAEFGATTGRPRRCGWLDLVALRYAVIVNAVDEIALTKLDVLGGLDEIKICGEYEIDGGRHSDFPGSAAMLGRAVPVYETMPGWKADISHCRTFGELPSEARAYVEHIERECGARVSMIGVGPGREDTIVRA